MRFEDVPKSLEFVTERKALFKPEDGIENMAFAETVQIVIKASAIKSEESRQELEMLADKMMKEAKKIIAEHEVPQ